MVKRVVDTGFWTDMQVIDSYSVEDKYFSLYLMTNDKSTQLGIYALPKKVISFETGYTSDVVQVLIDRFVERYKTILYSEETQEITLLDSLTFSVLKGGKPVSDLLNRELSRIKDTALIEATYHHMTDFWSQSKRVFDQTIKELFEKELANRGVIVNQNQNQNQNQNDNQIHLHNQSHNHNHNQESWTTIRPTIRDGDLDQEEEKAIGRYITYLTFKHQLTEDIPVDEVLSVYYDKEIGPLTVHITNQLAKWQKAFPVSLILEAIQRSTYAKTPLKYAESILSKWSAEGVKTLKDVAALDLNFSREQS